MQVEGVAPIRNLWMSENSCSWFSRPKQDSGKPRLFQECSSRPTLRLSSSSGPQTLKAPDQQPSLNDNDSHRMKSYIQYLNDSDDSSDPRLDCQDLDCSDRRVKEEGKRRVLARSLSDPLLSVPAEALPRRRGRRRPQRRGELSRSNSFDSELQCVVDPCNATKPTRRSSIEHNPTTLISAMKANCLNAKMPTRRGSMASSRSKSCSDVFEAPCSTVRRLSQENLAMRAKMLYKALDDMGLFDEEETVYSGSGSETSLTFTPL